MHKYEDAFQQVAHTLSDRIRDIMLRLPYALQGQVNEIRLRRDKPLMLDCRGRKIFLNDQPLRPVFLPDDTCIKTDAEDLEQTFRRLCEYSVHSFQEQVRAGYLTLPGGHRAGICGTAVTENGQVTAVRGINSIVLRISHCVNGAANDFLVHADPRTTRGILLAGPPASGKTTILRDLARQLTSGTSQLPVNVAIVDEKGEIAGDRMNDDRLRIGMCCDILNGYPKGEGILQAIRNLAPEVVLCDEVGSEQELEALEAGFHAGVHVVASVHAHDCHDLTHRRVIRRMLSGGGFEKVILLRGGVHVGQIAEVYRVEEQINESGGADFCLCKLSDDRIPENHSVG